ncbi:sigma-70 family RNA polymerase sigma factor [Bacillus toyonensis]|uniref:sigma-70 family RNA polymerase sigma factor n=1 Tax=Bacillus toyonensis TaxID=155322 RepID=UPI001CD2930D|nr:sigma-70 family RNA polymerase sigma factor [Bacillus toyonensis]MCA1042936.1 sigma-70 family RNA polymerase sigma factor [Bacillus toyonensis]
MEELINSYTHSLLEIRNAKTNANEEERKIFSGMISDLEFTLEWLRTGRRPGNRRGIERRAAYQRERACDPLLMQRYFRGTDNHIYEWDDHHQEHIIGEWDKIRLEDALSLLTAREKEVYFMSRGHCLTYKEIAKCLKLSCSTVQTMIERAEKKIVRQIDESLFCICR